MPPVGDLPIGSYLPLQPNPLFEGRVDYLKQLAKSLLKDSHTGVVVNQVITGMGGLGKTQLAVEFTYRYGRYFHGVHWLNLADPSQLDAEIARCGLQMSLPNWPEDQPSQVVLTLNTWKADGPRLLVLDNFEAVEQVNKVLPRLRHSNLRLLITSRRKDWTPGSGLHAMALDVFTDEEAIAFLKNALPERKEKEEDLKTLAERLGYLPLALELASRYLNDHPRLSLTHYLAQAKQAFQHPSMKDWRKDLPAPTEHDLDLQRTFALSWQSVKEETAQRLFQTAGYLAPNSPIPLEIFEKALRISSDTCDEMLNVLYGLGLLRRTDENLPLIHPILADFARHLSGENMMTLRSVAESTNSLADDANGTQVPSNFVPLRPHVSSLASYAEDAKLDFTYSLWDQYGTHLRAIADFRGSRAAYLHALELAESSFDPMHLNIGRVVNNLGLVLHDLGDFQGSQKALERAIQIWEGTWGADHSNVAATLNNLGNVLRDLGNHRAAQNAYERAMRIWESILGTNDPLIATILSNISISLRESGDLPGARSAIERAIQIDEANLAPNHLHTGRDMNTLGNVLDDLGDLDGARSAFEHAIQIFEVILGPEHPDLATALGNLGNVKKGLGDLPGARAALQRALIIDESIFGPVHPNVARDLVNLGLVLEDLGEWESAQMSFNRAIGIWEPIFGEDHADIAAAYNNLGNVLKHFGDTAKARVAFERALTIFKRALPPNHPNIKIAQANLDSLE